MTDMQSEGDLSFVRQELLQAAPPPMRVHGVWPWMRTNLFNGIGNSILTIVGVAHRAVAILIPVVQWAFINAIWDGDAATPAPPQTARRLLGLREGQFRPVHLRPLSRSRALARQRLLRADGGRHHSAGHPVCAVQGPQPPLRLHHLPGGLGLFCWSAVSLGLPVVETALWGGLFLTLVVSYVGMASVAAARHRPGARAALEDAAGALLLRRLHRRSAAACR